MVCSGACMFWCFHYVRILDLDVILFCIMLVKFFYDCS